LPPNRALVISQLIATGRIAGSRLPCRINELSALALPLAPTVDAADVVGAGARAEWGGSAGVRGGRDPPRWPTGATIWLHQNKQYLLRFGGGEVWMPTAQLGWGISALLGGGFDQPSER